MAYNQKDLPIDQVRTMRAKGLENNQIIQTLQREGYSSAVIFDAMNQADMPDYKGNISSPESSSEESNRNIGWPDSNPEESDKGMFIPENKDDSHRRRRAPPTNYLNDPAVEEMIEAVIDEKWNEFLKDLNKIIEWKNSTQQKIIRVEQQFDDLRKEFDKVHSAILSKVEDYDKNIQNVGAEVKAMEKVFGKVLPVFTENVSELSRIADRMKDMEEEIKSVNKPSSKSKKTKK